MRIILTFIIIFVSLINLKSFGQSNSNSAFGAVSFKYSAILNNNSVIAGGRFGWVINKSIVLGGGYYSLVSKIKTHIENNKTGDSPQLNFTYGGLELEYIFFPDNPVHFSISTLLAGGGLYFTNYDKSSANYYGIDMLVYEPSLNIEATPLRWLHVDLDFSYRFIGNFHDNYGLTKKDMKSLATGLTFKFGSF